MEIEKQYDLGDTLHRLMKQSLDSGTCKSVAEAEALFQKYQIHFEISYEDAASPEHQAALLTAVTLARRVCSGGVTCDDTGDVKLALPLPLGQTLREAVIALGGVVAEPKSNSATITLGDAPKSRREGFHVRTTYAGWRAGIVPAHSEVRAKGPKAIPIACSFAAALAVNEAYCFMSDAAPTAGRRVTGLSLWSLAPEVKWLDAAADEPELLYLPSKLWVIGLGHLGQAYLWTLGLLPYSDSNKCSLVLQDTDIITPSTESTSILTAPAHVGIMKTRAMANWAERRGFKALIYERSFDASFHRQVSEPAIALCGIDNAIGRSALDQIGFDLIVEAGLGRGHRDFRTMRLHTLPGPRKASEIWRQRNEVKTDVTENEAYQRILSDGTLDQCGITLLAGKAVGTPFVGTAAAAIAIAEILRLLHGGSLYQLVDLDLQSIEHRNVVPHPVDFTRMNPGFVAA